MLQGPVPRTAKDRGTEPDCNRTERTFGLGSTLPDQPRSSVPQLMRIFRTGLKPVLTGSYEYIILCMYNVFYLTYLLQFYKLFSINYLCTRVHQSPDLLMLDARTLRDFVTHFPLTRNHLGVTLQQQQQDDNNSPAKTEEPKAK